ncbi:zinc ribbon domain-containing protein [Marinicella sediminis]|uniref:Zinc ribbon domain-containing protein n=1 Tax=Marinicella sediminis TaxID=1792834 RepID=A0ABV7JCT5_9GAMM|nr:zinc ribbon domain-containing protein [Marinicella sediminis]
MQTIIQKEDIKGLSYDALVEHIRLSKVNSDEYLGLLGDLKAELKLREPTADYQCRACGHREYEERQIRASGGGISALFDVQNEKYRVITCHRCKYSELYQGTVGAGQAAIDFIFGG